jgi:nitrite reductase (NADH) small subunit
MTESTPRPFASQALENGTRVPLAPADSVPRGQGRCFSIGQAKIALFRQRDGTVFATAAACPHRNGPLADGLVGGGIVVCPLHGYRFRLSDGTGIDNDFQVAAYRAEIADGWIFVTLPQA